MQNFFRFLKNRRYIALTAIEGICVFIGISFGVAPCHADTDVTLLIWVQETKPAAFTQRRFEVVKRRLNELDTKPLRAVFFKKGVPRNFIELIKNELNADDKVTNIILATHGGTDTKGNKTMLEGLGGFDENGSFGELKEIIELLKPHLKTDLVLSMQACSTFCGEEVDIIKRISGLKNELSLSGVKNLAVWGSRNDLANDKDGTLWDADDYAKAMGKKIGRYVAVYSLFVGAGYFSLVSHFDFDLDSLKQTIAVTSAFAATTYIMGRGILNFLKKRVGINGYFIVADPREVRIINSPANSREAMGLGKCEMSLLSDVQLRSEN